MKFFTKKLITCALVCALSISPLGILNASAASVAGEATITDFSDYDDNWSDNVCQIKYQGSVVGNVKAHYYDGLITDKVQSSCTSELEYYHYATVSSKTSSSGDTIKTGRAYSGKVTLANNKAIFAGVVHVS